MAATGKVYGNTMKLIAQCNVNYLNDTIKVMLCTEAYVPNQDNHIYKDVHVTNEISGVGYSIGGITFTGKTITYDPATNNTILDANNVWWSDSFITARYAIIYDDTPAINKPLLGYIDFGENRVSSDGEFKITWPTSGIITITAT
jgi:hypothetical protein